MDYLQINGLIWVYAIQILFWIPRAHFLQLYFLFLCMEGSLKQDTYGLTDFPMVLFASMGCHLPCCKDDFTNIRSEVVFSTTVYSLWYESNNGIFHQHHNSSKVIITNIWRLVQANIHDRTSKLDIMVPQLGIIFCIGFLDCCFIGLALFDLKHFLVMGVKVERRNHIIVC